MPLKEVYAEGEAKNEKTRRSGFLFYLLAIKPVDYSSAAT